MTRQLTRFAFVVLLSIVALTLVVNLPPLEEVGKTPSSRFVTFSIDHWVTETHRNLQKARHAEMRADYLTKTDPSRAGEFYRDALFYYGRANDYAERRGSGAYLEDIIDEARLRLHKKISRIS